MDAFARWFGILRERGEVLDVKLLHFDSPSGPPLQRWDLRHEEYDGARAIEHVARTIGKGLLTLPQIRETQPPPFFTRARAVWREIRDARRDPVPWRHFDASARGSAEAPLAYTLFRPDEVEAIARRAEERGARSNSYLLWALDRAVYDELAYPSKSHRWAVPVNLRGALGSKEKMANVASAVAIDIGEGASPADIKSLIRAELERNAHWGVWDAFRILGFLGTSFMRRYAVRYYERPGHSWVGTFSNIGPYDADVGWVCGIPPVTRTHPISAGAVNMKGRLTLGLQTHPALGVKDIEGLVRRWRANIEGAT